MSSAIGVVDDMVSPPSWGRKPSLLSQLANIAPRGASKTPLPYPSSELVQGYYIFLKTILRPLLGPTNISRTSWKHQNKGKIDKNHKWSDGPRRKSQKILYTTNIYKFSGKQLRPLDQAKKYVRNTLKSRKTVKFHGFLVQPAFWTSIDQFGPTFIPHLWTELSPQLSGQSI